MPSTFTKVGKGRLSYPNLSKATAYDENQRKTFSCDLIVEKNSAAHKTLLQLERDCLLKQFGTLEDVPKGIRRPVRDSNDKTGKAGYDDGTVFVHLKSNESHPPKCVDNLVKEIPNDKIDQVLYAGCHVNVGVSAYYYDKAGNRGVSFNLGSVQFAGDDEPFGSVADPNELFEEEGMLDGVDLLN